MLALIFSPIGRYLMFAAVAALLIGGAYIKGRRDCSDLHATAALKAEVEVLKHRIGVTEQLRSQDGTKAEADAAEIARLKGLIDATPANPAACLDRNSSKRLRRIQ
jgi:hypothetical protein